MSIFNTGINPLNKFSKVVPIFLTISNDYAQYAAVAINSLMKHTNPERNYRVIILYDRLSLPNRWRLRSMVTKNCAIEFRKMKFNVHLQIIRTYCATKTGTGDFFSKTVYYYRAFIARLFPLYDKAVYIDSDTILLDDIGKLYDIDLGEKVIAARVDPKVTNVPEFKGYVENALGIPASEYVNSGVLVMDLKKLRKLHYITRMTDLMKDFDVSLVAPDQDYLNLILQGKIMKLDDNWNLEPAEELPKGAKLLHFNLFNKPWHYEDVNCEEYFWNAAKGTGFYGDLWRTRQGFTDEMRKKDHEKVGALIAKAGELAKTKEPIIKFEDKN